MIKQLLAAGLFASLASALLGATTPAYAATFDPGRIIDDSVMTNSSSMTAAQIQTFLNSKVPSCDTNGTQPASDFGRPDLTHAQYAALKGWQAPPYTCLKDKVENGLTAAQIIYNVSQQYSINPQVFVVLIQKESSLVTDTWPLNWQYNSATGYGCPDSTPGVCDTSYRGLTNQVTWAARLFRNVINQSPTWYSPYIKGSNFIQWSPIASCGGSVVNVQNWSTAALYDYTPYQPNQAALNAGYGMGDGCSAYGNRNFFLFFNDWFGATNAPAYSWKLMGQYAFTDQTKTSPTSLNNLLPGQRVFLSISALNQGNQTWTSSGSNPVRIGTSNPLERSSVFYDPSWISSGRPANLKESSVPPGQVGTFEFWIKAPQVTQTTNYNEYFNPLAEGAAWMNNIGLFYGTTVQKPTYTWSMASQYAYTDSSKTTVANLNNLLPGQKVFIGFTAKNTGNQTWLNSGANAVMAGTANPLDRRSAFSIGSDWLSASRPVLLKEASVAPGQIGTFEFWMTVPASGVSGIYHERFSLIANNLTWMNDVGLSYYMNIPTPTYTWSMASQYAYTNEAKSTVANMNNLAPGQKVYIGFTAKNTGNVPWVNSGPNAVMAGTASSFDRQSVFSQGSSWLSASRPALMKEETVLPGQIGTFEFWMTVPPRGITGVYNERFSLIANNLTWMNDVGLSYYMNVAK